MPPSYVFKHADKRVSVRELDDLVLPGRHVQIPADFLGELLAAAAGKYHHWVGIHRWRYARIWSYGRLELRKTSNMLEMDVGFNLDGTYAIYTSHWVLLPLFSQ